MSARAAANCCPGAAGSGRRGGWVFRDGARRECGWGGPGPAAPGTGWPASAESRSARVRRAERDPRSQPRTRVTGEHDAPVEQRVGLWQRRSEQVMVMRVDHGLRLDLQLIPGMHGHVDAIVERT